MQEQGDGRDDQGDEGEDEVRGRAGPERAVAGFHREVHQGLGGSDRVVTGVHEGRRADRLGVPDPEDVRADERVLVVEGLNPLEDALVRLLGAPGQVLQDVPAAVEHAPVPGLELFEHRAGLGSAVGGQLLEEGLAVEAIVARVVHEVDLGIGQGVLVSGQLGLGGGQVGADDLRPLGADPAEVVLEPEGVERADRAVVEQLFQLLEVGDGLVLERRLLLDRDPAIGGVGLLISEHLRLQLQELRGPLSPPALEGVDQVRGAGFFLGNGLLQDNPLPLGEGGVSGLHSLGEQPGEMHPRALRLKLQGHEVDSPRVQGDLCLDRGNPLGLDAGLPVEVDELLAGKDKGLAGRHRRQGRLALATLGVQGGEPLKDLVSPGPQSRDLGGQGPRSFGAEGLELARQLFQLQPGRIDRLLHLAEPGVGAPGVVGFVFLDDLKGFRQERVGRLARLVEQRPGLLKLRLELGRLALGRPLRLLGVLAYLVGLFPILEQGDASLQKFEERLRRRLLLFLGRGEGVEPSPRSQ
jgi:hypothetical protein